MLNIYYGDMDGVIFNTSVYFRNVYRDEWITAPLSIEMIRDVDNSEVLSEGVIDSPVLGKIPPTGLSGGVKALILVENMPDKIFNVTNCGDNCAKWLLRIAEDKEVSVNLRYLMHFGDGYFNIRILNNNQIVHSTKELFFSAVEFV